VKIIRTDNFLKLQPSSSDAAGRTITIGNFDGCHLGHIKLFDKTMQIAKATQTTPCILTFDPHPLSVLSDAHFKEKQLFTKEQKINFFKQMGFTEIIIQKFSPSFSQLSCDDFYHTGLRKTLNAQAIVVGENFLFGHNRRGNSTWLSKNTQQDNIQLHLVPKQRIQEKSISSTLIRKLINNEGQLILANKMLGRPFMLEGSIATGQQQGRNLGFPTINLSNIKQTIPKNGVYYGYTWIQESLREQAPFLTDLKNKHCYPSVMNIGYKPTLEKTKNKLHIESHMIDHKLPFNSLYEKKACFYFVNRIRDEVSFPSIEELKEQIKKDIAFAKDQMS
jgi:riboflavin kinase/FMN adenylyltransferase